MPYITLDVGSRYSDDRVYGAPEPSYGMGHPDYAVQPRLYDIHHSGRHEAPASGAVRALRGGPVLADTWLVRQDTWAVQLGGEGAGEVVPALTLGPEEGELPGDRPEDDDKPRVSPQVPTDELLARYLPQTSRAEPRPSTAAVSVVSGFTTQALPASLPDPPPAFRLVRERHVEDLEGRKRAAHEESLAALEGRLAGYNALLRRPCHFALHL
ncbi:Primary ciliary dyskinesia protein 1 [Tetrabaena socialis]|uniref:Primary ciliary dyskinesia protein 1 n=1 Tax=Tetrabaena socialis TaxID=47790 RepID=A0A2J8A8B3_9CHLO|nr:Primary ciliary dyskinesia protein 1 [Tetrabaena socialis]|eukprot:PNH08745.1 Primary ciliary dyskinesia protein 1 [Tetrabaena socialis]